jgi:hypothetical protein
VALGCWAGIDEDSALFAFQLKVERSAECSQRRPQPLGVLDAILNQSFNQRLELQSRRADGWPPVFKVGIRRRRGVVVASRASKPRQESAIESPALKCSGERLALLSDGLKRGVERRHSGRGSSGFKLFDQIGLGRIRSAEDGFEQLSVQGQRVQIVADGRFRGSVRSSSRRVGARASARASRRQRLEQAGRPSYPSSAGGLSEAYPRASGATYRVQPVYINSADLSPSKRGDLR